MQEEEESQKEVEPSCEDKNEQILNLIQRRERICSFSEVHAGGNSGSHYNTFTQVHSQWHDDASGKQREAHPMPQTPMFKPQSQQMRHHHQEAQDNKKEYQLPQKSGVINLDLDQDSMETEQDLHESGLVDMCNNKNNTGSKQKKENQRFKETQHNQDQKLSKSFSQSDREFKQAERIPGKEYQSSSTGNGVVFSNKSRENHLQGLLKKRHHMSDKIETNTEEIQDEDEHSNYSVNKVYDVLKKQKLDRLQRFQTQKSQQKISQMSYLSVPYVNSVQKIVEKGQIPEKSRYQDQVASSIQSQSIQVKQPTLITQIEQPKDQKDIQEIKVIPCTAENKQSVYSTKLESIQTQQPIPDTTLQKGTYNNNKSQLLEQKEQEKEKQNILAQPLQQKQQLPALLQQQEGTFEKLEPQHKGGLFGNLKAPLISQTNQPCNVEKQPQSKEEQLIVKQLETQQKQELVQLPKQEQLLQAHESKKSEPQLSSAQTPLFSNVLPSNSLITQPTTQLDSTKQQEKIPQQSLFNNSGLFSEKQQQNQKVILSSNSSESHSPAPSSVETKVQGASLFSNIAPKPSGSLFSQAPSNQANKEQLGSSLLIAKQTNGQLESSEQTNKPQEAVKLFENSTSNQSSLQNTQKDETKVQSAPLTGGLFSQAIKNSGSSQPGLFSNISSKNGLFPETQQLQQLSGLVKTEVNPNKDLIEKKQQTETRSIFGNLSSSSQGNSDNTSLTATTQPKNSLFGSGNNSGTGLFSQLKQNPLSQINLVGGLFNPKNTSIETKSTADISQKNTGNVNSQNLPSILPQTGLFAPKIDNNTNNVSKGSLFSIPNGSSQKSQLFPSSGLFETNMTTQKQTGGSLFGNLAKPSNSSFFASATAAASQSN